MILIAHRGLINGPDLNLENTEFAISVCLSQGYDVEVDVWFDIENNTWWSGHDKPTYNVSQELILQKGLWLHCKNFAAATRLRYIINEYPHLNFFWHENDKRTLTSQGYWWTYPNNDLSFASIALMPEWYSTLENLDLCLTWNCAGICSDYVGVIK